MSDALVKRPLWNSGPGCPVGKTERLAHEGEKARPSGIVGLRAVGGPNAVFRRIITVIIEAFNGHAGWPWRWVSHVGVKIFEYLPPFADLDAASAIAIPSRIVGVGCAGQHHGPNGVNLFFCFSMGQKPTSGRFTSKTAAGSRNTFRKTGCADNFLRAAITCTMPSGGLPRIRSPFPNRQSTESHSAQIFHIDDSIVIKQEMQRVLA